jgi:dynein heavy chain
LTILSNGTNPPKVCEFIGDCFDGLKTVRFCKANPGEIPKKADALISKDKEIVEFTSEPFECKNEVENWLSDLEQLMRYTLYKVLEQSKITAEYWDNPGESKPREEWCADYPAQCALLTTQMVWTEDVTRAFEELQGGQENAMKEALRLIELRIEALIRKVRGDLSVLERNKIINIITSDVHSRDVVEKFCINKVQEPESFAWLSQLKFYWESSLGDMA